MRTFLPVLIFLSLFTSAALAQDANQAEALIDRGDVLFGVEYTFQDREMVNEPGRNTLTTPHKEKKVREFSQTLAAAIGLSAKNIEVKTSWKPGVYLNVPGDGQWVLNSEPVTIEINTTPRLIDQIEGTSKPIFDSAAAIGLQPYMNPGAERSGMGHIHVGARKMAENPFFRNPRLLRNIMVSFHKNPALLHGFAEAFDIGMNSNIETYHIEQRQRLFQAAVAEFDTWYDKAAPVDRAGGMSMFLRILAKHDLGVGFFEHYRAINLEHVKRGATKAYSPEEKGKITVEFRNFRPPKDPETARAFAELLMAEMNYQARPDHVETFRWISLPEYRRFNTSSKIQENWSEVRGRLGLALPKLEEQIRETVNAVSKKHWELPGIRGSRVHLAYTEKTLKGTRYEVRISAGAHPNFPVLTIGDHSLDFEKIRIGNQSYWLATFDLKENGTTLENILSGVTKVQLSALACAAAF